MSEQGKLFLTRMYDQIDEGQYDDLLTIPFLTKDLLKSSLKARMDKKLETNSTPLLSDTEVKDALADAKEVAVLTAAMLLEMGILKKTAEGIKFDDKWKDEIFE